MVATVSRKQAYVDVQYGRFTTGTHPETTPYRGPTMMSDVEGAPQYHVETSWWSSAGYLGISFAGQFPMLFHHRPLFFGLVDFV
jgi:hypothetical protein